MTAPSAYSRYGVELFHKLLAMSVQHDKAGVDLPEEMLKDIGLTSSDIDELFKKEDSRGIRDLRAIVNKITERFFRGKRILPEKYTHLEKPFLVYDFETERKRTRIISIYIGIKPDESRLRKYAEWLISGRSMEHARGTIVVKDPDAPPRPEGVEKVVFQLMSNKEKRQYKKNHHNPEDKSRNPWEKYAEEWGEKNKEQARRFVGTLESIFEVVDAHPSHLVFDSMLLTATSHVHAFVPHILKSPKDLEGKLTEIRQNTYRFRNRDEAKEFFNQIIAKQGKPLTPNERYMHFLTNDVLPYDEIRLFQESPTKQCLIVRDKDIVMEVIAPIFEKYPMFESQMYYIPRVALLKKEDHVVTWPSEGDAIGYISKRLNTAGAKVNEKKWFPRGVEGYSVSVGKNRYFVMRIGSRTLETRYDTAREVKERMKERFDLYKSAKKKKTSKGKTRELSTHYLDNIAPNQVDLSLGWFAQKDTRPDIFYSRHGMKKDPRLKGIRSNDYFSHPKRNILYGPDYEYAGSINVDIVFGGVRYEFQIVTPETEIENEVGRFSREEYEKRKRKIRKEELLHYSAKSRRLLGI